MYVLSIARLSVCLDRNRHTLAQADFAAELEQMKPEQLARSFQAVVAASLQEGVDALCDDIARLYGATLKMKKLPAEDLRVHIREQEVRDGRFWEGGGSARGNPWNVATRKLV